MRRSGIGTLTSNQGLVIGDPERAGRIHGGHRVVQFPSHGTARHCQNPDLRRTTRANDDGGQNVDDERDQRRSISQQTTR